ncbi:MAG: tripartite tricarboxylate transporter substrate binding protein [Burkholderiales bacterium]|nr:tripartite tricarboxylate transporter substrate binding protein [Burkholderiales bacterium]
MSPGIAGALLAAVAGVPAAHAQPAVPSYPQRPIRMLVPFPAGGPTDIVARTIAQRLTDLLGQTIVVDNRGGANGVIAQTLAARAAPDGYTLFVHSVAFVVNSMIYKVPYDNERDFQPLTLVQSFPLMLVIHPSVAANSVKELVALARERPGKLLYSSYGQGSIAQLAAEMMKTAETIDITHVLYKGAPQGLGAVVANEVQVSFPSFATGAPLVKQGRLKGLAVTSRKRSPQMPEMPTMIEAGVRDFEATSWFGSFFPAGTPAAIVNRMHQETVKLLRIPEVKASFEAQAFEIIAAGPSEFRTFIRNEQVKYAKVIKAANIRVE